MYERECGERVCGCASGERRHTLQSTVTLGPLPTAFFVPILNLKNLWYLVVVPVSPGPTTATNSDPKDKGN